MRKLIYITTLLLVIVSCSHDFVELNPTSSVNVDVLYKTDKDFQDALTAVYNRLQSQYQSFYILGDMRSDDSWEEIAKNNSMSYSDQFTTSSSDGLMNSSWSNYYIAIFRCNTLLSRIEDVDVSILNEKERHIAEAKFLRAFAYFDLVRIFGDVPLVTTPISVEESLETHREPVNNIYNQIIIPDLLAAENSLPDSYSGSEIGKPTKGAARALLGRVYMTINDFQNAESKLKEVTTMGYSLLEDYNDLFDYLKDEHHSEYIFDIEYEEGIGEGSQFTNLFAPNYVPFADFYGIGGFGNEHNNPTQTLISLFSDNDLRKDVSVGVTGGFYNADSVFVPLPTSTNQTYTKKYLVPVAAMNDSRANWKVIRYADVLLMLAEALNENGKMDQAIPYLNQVRERAGLTGYSTGMTQDALREAIAIERRLELSFEGVRWFDLVRTGKAYETLKDKGMREYMVLWPIPLSQIEVVGDPSVFPQNPGYD